MTDEVRELVDSVLLFKRSEFGKAQRDFIEAGIARQQEILENSRKLVDVHRAQGALAALRQVCNYEDNLIKEFQSEVTQNA